LNTATDSSMANKENNGIIYLDNYSTPPPHEEDFATSSRNRFHSPSTVENHPYDYNGEAGVETISSRIKGMQDELLHLKVEESLASNAKKEAELAYAERDEVLVQVDELMDQIKNLKVEGDENRSAKEQMNEFSVENEMLRNINKDLRNTMVSLTRKMKHIQKTESKGSNVETELKQLQDYKTTTTSRMEDLQEQHLYQKEKVEILTGELEDLNVSYYEVTTALVTKSKEYFMVKSELDELRKVSDSK